MVALPDAVALSRPRRPRGLVPATAGRAWPETYGLVRTDPPIEWRGDPAFAARWGPDHPLCSPIEPTSLALVMASSPWSGPVDPTDSPGVSAYTVRNEPSRVKDADPILELGVKAGLRVVPGTK